jgi:hypothetical protein
MTRMIAHGPLGGRPRARQPSCAARWRVAGCLLVAVLLAACSSGHPAAGTGKPSPGARPPGGAFFVGPNGFLPMGGPVPEGGGLRPQISVGRIPTAGSGQTIVMPVDSYEQAINQEQAAIAAATVLLVHRCMQAAGFSYPAVPQAMNDERILQSIEQPADGLVSLTQAQTYGFGHPRAQPVGNGPVGGESGMIICGAFGCVPLHNMRTHSHAWMGALLGTYPGARVRARPQPGCLATAQIQLTRRHPMNDPLLPLASQAGMWTRSDPRVLAVQRSWSACMAARGYHYQSVLQPEQRRWPTPPNRAEIATAVADVSCKIRVNLPNTWLAVEAAYQRALIGANLGVLSQLQTNFNLLLQRAETLLAAAP